MDKGAFNPPALEFDDHSDGTYCADHDDERPHKCGNSRPEIRSLPIGDRKHELPVSSTKFGSPAGTYIGQCKNTNERSQSNDH